MNGRFIDELDEYIATLELEHTLIAERLELTRQLRATFGPIAVVSAAPVPPPVVDTTASLSPVPSFECAHCGRKFSRQNGLSRHLSQSHPIERRRFDHQAARDAAAAAA